VWSSKRALAWFQSHEIEVQKQRVNKLTKEDLIKLPSLSGEGTFGVLKCASRSSSNVNKMLNHIMKLTFNEALDFILKHPIMLQATMMMKYGCFYPKNIDVIILRILKLIRYSI